jgi:hypothetical protein
MRLLVRQFSKRRSLRRPPEPITATDASLRMNRLPMQSSPQQHTSPDSGPQRGHLATDISPSPTIGTITREHPTAYTRARTRAVDDAPAPSTSDPLKS